MSLFAIIAVVAIVVVIATVLIVSAVKKGDKDAKTNTSKSSNQDQKADDDFVEEGDEDSHSFSQMSKREQEAYKKEKQEREWNDPDEFAKYVCQGGKVQCPFASPDTAEIIVTSTTIQLQDKPWATVKDKDGKMNFNFTGICKHPSHGSNKPPCKAVISLGEWKDYSETLIDNKNALVVQATIPCMISGQDLKIVDSGQKTKLENLESTDKRKPRVVKMYWMDEKKERKLKGISKGQTGILCVQTEYFLPEKTKISIPLKDEEGEVLETLEGNLDSDGWGYIKWTNKIKRNESNSSMGK